MFELHRNAVTALLKDKMGSGICSWVYTPELDRNRIYHWWCYLCALQLSTLEPCCPGTHPLAPICRVPVSPVAVARMRMRILRCRHDLAFASHTDSRLDRWARSSSQPCSVRCGFGDASSRVSTIMSVSVGRYSTGSTTPVLVTYGSDCQRTWPTSRGGWGRTLSRSGLWTLRPYPAAWSPPLFWFAVG